MNTHGITQPEPAGFPQLPASGAPHQRASLAAGVKVWCPACLARGVRKGETCWACGGRGSWLHYYWPRVGEA